MEVSDLLRRVDELERRVRTNSLDLSLNEIADMVNNNELIIDPDYQRLLQWSEGARSRFIESLILELPVPPIFVVEEEGGQYSLIDGLQRISSYLHFRGYLSFEDEEEPVIRGEHLILSDCDIMPELNGMTFDKLPTTLQYRVKRSFLRVEVIRRGNDPHLKYHMFKRLNSGGVNLSPQQVRNSTIRLLDNKFINFIRRLSEDSNFSAVVSLISREDKRAFYDHELVLRYFAFKNKGELFRHDIEDFLTEYMEEVAEADSNKAPIFHYGSEEAEFRKTFEILNLGLQEKAFGYYNERYNKIVGFSVMVYEAVILGLLYNQDKIETNNRLQIELVAEAINSIKSQRDFLAVTKGGGKNSVGPFRRRVELMKDAIESRLNEK